VVAYAGMPLTDQDGLVLGSLCAIDRVPRAWSDVQVRTLHRIAEACSADLRLRLAGFAQGAEDLRRDAADLAAQRAYERS
jgi:GAF domain-containing protein